jgi:amidophosphoribosyltransferase
MDTGTRGELLAANLDLEEIRAYLNVDSLAYLSLDRLVDATGARGAGFCTACLTGDYPVEVPITLHKSVLEIAEPSAKGGASSAITTEADGLFPTEEFQRRSG